MFSTTSTSFLEIRSMLFENYGALCPAVTKGFAVKSATVPSFGEPIAVNRVGTTRVGVERTLQRFAGRVCKTR